MKFGMCSISLYVPLPVCKFCPQGKGRANINICETVSRRAPCVVCNSGCVLIWYGSHSVFRPIIRPNLDLDFDLNLLNGKLFLEVWDLPHAVAIHNVWLSVARPTRRPY